MLIAGVAALGRFVLTHRDSDEGSEPGQGTAVVFALLLALIGLTLTFGVEFLYIRDSFESRMNTVFKLYYQSWLLLAIASAFGAFYVWQATGAAGRSIWIVRFGVVEPSKPTTLARLLRGVWVAAFGVMFVLSMVYPVLAYPNRANNFKAGNGLPTLDGWRWVERTFPDDYAAIEWARVNIRSDAVILEAAGAQYSFDNRISVATGLATVLGWGGHEFQWRGNSNESDPRARDIEEIYKTRDTGRARELLNEYNVSFVFVGDIERNKYNLSAPLIEKFGKLGEKVFEQGTMRVYHVGQVSASLNTP
jgi:YYY domain-containing protein